LGTIGLILNLVSSAKESLIKCDVRIAKWIFVPGKAEEGAYIAVY